MGTPGFAKPSLRALCDSSHDVVAVVTNPDAPKGRGQKTGVSPVKQFALERGLALIQPMSLAAHEFHGQLAALHADLFVVVAFRILPMHVVALPRLGSINVHASLLPRYRGAAPIQWAIINGETRTGITVFFLDRVVDGGEIIRQVPVDIGADETAGELSLRLQEIGAQALVDSVDGIAAGSMRRAEQDGSAACKAPKIGKDDCRIDFTRSAREIYNFIRGFTPAPGAWTTLNGKRIMVAKAACFQGASGTPGAIVAVKENGIDVATGEGVIRIIRLKPENRQEMAVEDFVNGYRIQENHRFGG